ncbi:polyketide cyclase [Chryseobacterium indologenes]|uniref:SRPBCC family protein n=1 Tax=Chryseobacterium TaxID=59732 RepID=UPI000486C22D|nr:MULTISPECIES: SRPBCC family protein [Chryseobacterium]ASE61333.1 polyketide cyclase [Chryseobacterium indologenes]AYZ35594.1 polyketide cyclase [Chryseobacterium indologenes]MBF6644350.1 SRPBCC family protein [Chryseobacterium indologenes]MBU3049405.1 SRPBCC family protein [Chryseobacterium indologenes]MEB4759950.1 SRPBCC family protein [Chryseobacterium indologenes]
MSSNVYVEAQMLIRKPVEDVFEAFINPEVTTNFWFTKSTGKLEEGKTITWEWEMYNVKNVVNVLRIIPNQLIKTQWGEPSVNVDYEFKKMENGTLVVIKSYGFRQTGEELLKQINDNTGGFTTVLDGCKAYLEHGINLRLIEDKFPSK